ncbi:hypothetical protein BJ987_002640 [Nocardia goodfellowii]|uniref:Uncharacterized protein n=1 Tax=Nocardia goodfellowii TaxID=882446 RepID=A0ABS4QDH5_9NOCA|nr:hypothetical protein [Nocardia goodfellowii]
MKRHIEFGSYRDHLTGAAGLSEHVIDRLRSRLLRP